MAILLIKDKKVSFTRFLDYCKGNIDNAYNLSFVIIPAAKGNPLKRLNGINGMEHLSRALGIHYGKGSEIVLFGSRFIKPKADVNSLPPYVITGRYSPTDLEAIVPMFLPFSNDLVSLDVVSHNSGSYAKFQKLMDTQKYPAQLLELFRNPPDQFTTALSAYYRHCVLLFMSPSIGLKIYNGDKMEKVEDGILKDTIHETGIYASMKEQILPIALNKFLCPPLPSLVSKAALDTVSKVFIQKDKEKIIEVKSTVRQRNDMVIDLPVEIKIGDIIENPSPTDIGDTTYVFSDYLIVDSVKKDKVNVKKAFTNNTYSNIHANKLKECKVYEAIIK
jgi:hypothetical protein